jgi:hypothetical protein
VSENTVGRKIFGTMKDEKHETLNIGAAGG